MNYRTCRCEGASLKEGGCEITLSSHQNYFVDLTRLLNYSADF